MTAAGSSETASVETSLWGPPLLRWLAFGLCLLLAGCGLFMLGPQVEADEGSYLLNAAMIAGRIPTNPSYGYYSGYSLLLLPAFLLQSQPTPIYHLALLINAVLLSSTPFALYRLTRVLWPNIDPRTHVVAATVAACCAPVLMLSQHTMSENALVPLYAWLLASGATLLHRDRVLTAVAFGTIAGFLFLVHPRGATMAAPTLSIFALFALVSRDHRRAMAIACVVAVAVAALHAPLEQFAGRTQGSGGYSLSVVLAHFRAPGAWRWLAFNLVGTTTEAIVASFGLFVIALRAIAAGLESAWRNDEYRRMPQAAILLACASGMAVALLVTAAFFVPPERADQLAYGRYALPTLVPLLAIGLIRLHATRAQRLRDLAWAIAAGLIGIAISASAFTLLPAAAKANWNFVNSIALYLAQRFVPFIGAWAAIASCFVALMAVLCLCIRHSSRRAVTMYLAFNLAIAAVAWLTTTLPGSRYYAADRRVVEAARAFGATDGNRLCIAFGPGVDAWHRPDVGWRLFPQIAQHDAGRNCAHGTVMPLNSRPLPDTRLVAIERPSPLGTNIPLGLFVKNGLELERFGRTHELPPENALVPMPDADRQAGVVIENPATAPLLVPAGKPLDLHLRVTNRGTETWSAHDDGLLPYPVLAGAHVGESGEVRWNYRAPLPRSLAPGQSTDVSLRIGPIDRPGDYELHVGIVQEHVAWFAGGIDTTLEVADGPR